MRNAFAQELTRLAAIDERIVLLSGDIGNRLFDSFKEQFPQRFFNCGVAEANMMSVAAGMAMCGLRPVAYTIAPFITTRCLEQIRVDVCYHHAPVIIAGVGAGLSYAGLGPTHHSCEDIAHLRVLPNMTVVCPCDPVEVRLALGKALQWDHPLYLRLGKKGEPIVHTQEVDFQIGKPIELRSGHDITLLVAGNLAPEALNAADLLDQQGVSARVVSMHTIKPLDESFLANVFHHSTKVATIEEHSVLGGLGGAVSEWLTTQEDRPAKLVRIGVTDEFFHEAGSQSHARRRLGIDAAGIVKTLLEK